jgi:hypothetical protein
MSFATEIPSRKDPLVGSREGVVKALRGYFKTAKLSLGDVRAVYLWGSVLRSDFHPALSDLDCVAIGGSRIEESELDKLRDQARTKHKQLEQLSIRCLYLCDFNDPEPQSELARLIDPRLLLADFPSWILVWGRPLSPSSFALRPCSLDEAYSIRLRTLRLRVQRCLAVPQTEAPLYSLKEAAYLIHLIHQLSQGPHLFSYSRLERHSTSVTVRLSRAIPRLRRKGWPELDCAQSIPLVLEMLDQIDSLPAQAV